MIIDEITSTNSRQRVYERSKDFAIRIVKLYHFLTDTAHEYVISKQILKSGTSIGANLAESQFGITKKDFLNKLYIALKECAETIYWLELLTATEYITASQFDSLNSDATDIRNMLISSCKTIRHQLDSSTTHP